MNRLQEDRAEQLVTDQTQHPRETTVERRTLTAELDGETVYFPDFVYEGDRVDLTEDVDDPEATVIGSFYVTFTDGKWGLTRA